MSKITYLKTDTASIMFSALTTKVWGRTFRFSALLNEPPDADTLRRAVSDVLEHYPNMRASLKRGFFWCYQTVSDAEPEIRPEGSRPLLPITSAYRGLPNLRFVTGKKEIALECSHCACDGRGGMRFFREVLKRYFYLADGGEAPYEPFVTEEDSCVNAYDTYYDKGGEKDKSKLSRAYRPAGDPEPDFLRLTFAETSKQTLLDLAHARRMTVTEYLCAVIITAVVRSAGEPVTEPVTIAVPVDLRRFFPTKTLRNFTVQTYVVFDAQGKNDIGLDEVCAATAGQLRQSLTKENLGRTINKYGALKTNPALRIVPYFIKRPALVSLQKSSHAGVTTILTNLGERPLGEELRGRVARVRFVNGDTRAYGLPATVSCISAGDTLSLCFSEAGRDIRWPEEVVRVLREEGAEVETDVREGVGKPQPPEAKAARGRLTFAGIKAYFGI